MEDKNVSGSLGSEACRFRVKCLNFYVELSEQIGKRFRGLSDVFPLFNACDPVVARVSAVKSLVPLFRKFPQLIHESQYDVCNNEWRSLVFHEESLTTSNNPAEFWCSVQSLKSNDGTLLFPNLSKFMLCLLVLPHSSAAVERIFSQIKLIKTDTRSRLNTESVNGLLLSKGNGGAVHCYQWEPSNLMMNSAQNVFK